MHLNRSFLINFIFISFVISQNNENLAADSLQALIPVYKADPVIVTATRSSQPILQTPYAIEHIGIEKIQDGQKLISLQETLQSVPGLFINNRSNFALGDRISIRGIGARSSFGVRGIKILVDGIPLTMPDGQSQLNNLDLGSVGTIEIIKGPSGSLYGNAAGGLINIQTEEVTKHQLQLKPQITFGSDNLLHLQAMASGTLGPSNFLLNINKFQSDGFRENSASEHWSMNAINSYTFSENVKMTAVVNYFNTPYSLNPSSLSKEDAEKNRSSSRYFVKQQGAGEKVSHGQAGVTFNYKPSSTEQFKLTLFGMLRSLTNPIPSRIIELDRSAGGLRMTYSAQNYLGNFQLNWTGGVDTEFQFDKRTEFENEGLPSEMVDKIDAADVLKNIEYGPKLQQQDEQVVGIGPFIKLEIPFHPKWRVTCGGRFDHYRFKVTDHFLTDSSDDTGNKTMQQFSPMAGLLYMYSPSHSAYFNYSTAFQTPTTTELGNQASGDGGLNPNLKPELIHNYEIGFKGIMANLKLQYQMAFYHMQFTNMLVPFQGISEEVYYRNAGKAQNSGLELSIDWQLSNLFNMQLSYTFMDFKFSEYRIDNPGSSADETINLKNKKIAGVTPHRFYSSVRYTHPTQTFALLQMNWTDKYFTNDFNGPVSGSNLPQKNYINNGYTTFDFRFGKTWQFSNLDLQLFTGIDNIFDALYNNSVVPNANNDNFFEPAPGRSWYCGIKLIL